MGSVANAFPEHLKSLYFQIILGIRVYVNPFSQSAISIYRNVNIAAGEELMDI